GQQAGPIGCELLDAPVVAIPNPHVVLVVDHDRTWLLRLARARTRGAPRKQECSVARELPHARAERFGHIDIAVARDADAAREVELIVARPLDAPFAEEYAACVVALDLVAIHVGNDDNTVLAQCDVGGN